MKKIWIVVSLFFASLGGLRAQDMVYGEHAEKREIKAFHAVETSAGIAVVLTKGSKEEIALTASDKEMLSKVKTEVVDGVLKISREDNWKFWERFKQHWKITVYVSYTRLDGVRASSGGSITSKSVDLSTLSARVNSGGHISLAGKVNELDVEGNSGGHFRGYDLSVTNCKANVSSGAHVQVTIAKEITARASSGGQIRYKGTGLIRDINVNSGGSVKRED